MYKLCQFLALALLKKDLAGAEPPPYKVIALSGELFQRMKPDPFQMIADIGTNIVISSADLETQAQIANLIAQIIDEIHGQADP